MQQSIFPREDQEDKETHVAIFEGWSWLSSVVEVGLVAVRHFSFGQFPHPESIAAVGAGARIVECVETARVGLEPWALQGNSHNLNDNINICCCTSQEKHVTGILKMMGLARVGGFFGVTVLLTEFSGFLLLPKTSHYFISSPNPMLVTKRSLVTGRGKQPFGY
jgi:hypothetical protein